MEISIPTGYNKPIIVTSADYQKLVKEMSNIGNTLKVTSKNFQIEFSCNAGGILKRTVQFGEVDDDDETDENVVEFSQEFITEQLSRITKLSGLSNTLQIFPGKPLLFVSTIGSLGKISIYIKSKEQIEVENYNILDDSDSDG